MCRIAGIITRVAESSNKRLAEMLVTLAHGGPDDEGTYCDNHVALGHRRLSIIDLSPGGHQPMMSDDDSLVIVFNGEIYNYRELTKELESLGATFHTASDTEVILKAYQKWGNNSFQRLQGMFAFALYDKVKGKILLVRDHLGIKPLYFSSDKERLIFASEVKAFLTYRKDWKQRDDWQILFLAFGSIPHPFTTVADVFQLSPGHCLEFDLGHFTSRLFTYETTKETGLEKIVDTEDALKKIQDECKAALRRHLISDAPLGVFLSGGIDSSLLTLLADKEVQHELSAVSVNFAEATFDELPFQKKVMAMTSNAQQKSYTVDEHTFWDHIGDIWKAMDQPTIDGVNTYFVSYYARQAGLKAVLSGLGADEYFGGYASFNRISMARYLRMLPFKKLAAKGLGMLRERYKRILFLDIPGAVGDYLFLRGLYTPGQIAKLLDIQEEVVWSALKNVSVEVPSSLSDKEYASFLESKIYMTNQLLKDTDFMSMWHGLEVRVPFLDIDLVRLAQRISPAIRYRRDRPKFLLTAAFKSILPKEIVFRKKKGFTFPFSTWIKNNSGRFRELLPPSGLAVQVEKDFLRGKTHWSKYWSLIVMEKFSHQ